MLTITVIPSRIPVDYSIHPDSARLLSRQDIRTESCSQAAGAAESRQRDAIA